jgi:hypothetical protein
MSRQGKNTLANPHLMEKKNSDVPFKKKLHQVGN